MPSSRSHARVESGVAKVVFGATGWSRAVILTSFRVPSGPWAPACPGIERSFQEQDQRIGVPSVSVTTNNTRNSPITRIRTPRSRGCADCIRYPQAGGLTLPSDSRLQQTREPAKV